MNPQPGSSRSLLQPSPSRSATKPAKTLAVAAMALFLAGAARAGSISFNNTNDPPFNPLASLYITNLFDAYLSPAHGTDYGQGSNCGNGGTTGLDPNDASVYTGAGGWVGQSFVTGAAGTGYKLISTSVRQVAYLTSFTDVTSTEYILRITKIGTGSTYQVDDTNTVTVVAQETAEVGVDWSGFPTSNISGDGGRGGNYGRYLTFTFDTPVPLLPNTKYGFDIGITKPSGTYWEMDGRRYIPGTTTPYDGYPAGNAYTDFTNSLTIISNVPGDRAFIVALNPATTVTPPRFTSEYRKDGRPRSPNQPQSGTWFEGQTATFRAKAAGDTNLAYQWLRFGTNISDGAKYSGVLTDTLSVSNVAAGDSGSAFTLVVTNSAGAITSAPPAILTTIAPPTPGSYAYNVYASKPIAYYRLNESVNPATNPPTFDNMGGGVGHWETNAVRTNGPKGSPFIGFENSGGITNYATQSSTNAAIINYSWSTLAPLHLKTNSATFTAWIYPNGPPGVQGGKYSGLFFTRAGSSECGMCVGDSSTAINGVGQLAYTWNNGVGNDRSWPSGFVIPANQWVFIGLVITPTNGTVYFAANGGPLQSAVHSVPESTETWDGPWTAGYDPRWAGPNGAQYTFNGVVDELAAWDRSLSFIEMTNLYAAAFTSTTSGSTATAVVSGSATICNGGSTTISAALTGTGPWNVSWSDGSNQNAVATSPATRNVSPSTTTTYTVTALSDANGAAPSGNLTGSAVVMVNARPTSVASGTATICNGGSTTISAALTGTGPWNVSWSDGSNQNAVATSPATRNASPSTTTTYTVTALSDANCTAVPADLTGSAVVTVNACLAPVTITDVSGTTLSYTGGAGSKFILLKSADVTAALSSWSREATNTVTPGSFTIPAVGTGSPVFYAVKSE